MKRIEVALKDDDDDSSKKQSLVSSIAARRVADTLCVPGTSY